MLNIFSMNISKTFSKVTLGIEVIHQTFSITLFCHYAECHYVECDYAECRYAKCCIPESHIARVNSRALSY
jgi:hypothetical protein